MLIWFMGVLIHLKKLCFLLNLDFGSFHVDLDFVNDGLCVLSTEEEALLFDITLYKPKLMKT